MSSLLSVKNMTHYFGGLRAVHNYNLEIAPQQITGLIGPNGAGKTTIFNLITGVYTPQQKVRLPLKTRASSVLKPMKLQPKAWAGPSRTWPFGGT